MKFSLLIAVIFFSFFALPGFSQAGPSKESKQKLEAALDIVFRMYVEELQDDEMVENAINGMLKELDPHSYYISAERVEAINEPLKGSFQGIGVHFNILNDTIIIVAPIPGGPSEKLGILAGDKIVSIEGQNVAGKGIKNSEVRDKLLGEDGSKVSITIYRREIDDSLDFEIKRADVPISSLDASYMMSPGIGYIKINRFSATTVKEFRTALSGLKKDGMQNLVLDLRGNTGGYLLAAYELADEFLDKGKLIVYYEGEASPKRELRASSRGGFEEGKLVVLIDESSASASEIVSGAIQDWDRGLVIGRRSYGKGLVQREFELPDGAAIRLTVARYFTPTGRSIQKPYENGQYKNEISERYEPGEMISYQQIEIADSLKYFTPNNRVVYGGGGILPDIYIPIDTTEYTSYYKEVVRLGLLNSFALQYFDRHREEMISAFPNIAGFKEYADRSVLLEEFVKFAEDKGIEPERKDLKTSKELLKNQITGLVARNLYNESAYFQIVNERNDFVIKSLEVIEKDIFDEMKVQNF